MTYYTRDIEMPKTKRDGLANFVQLIINSAEAGDAREAMLKGVDLLDDIQCGNYDDAMTDAKAINTALNEQIARHQTEITDAYQRGFSDGVENARTKLTQMLDTALAA